MGITYPLNSIFTHTNMGFVTLNTLLSTEDSSMKWINYICIKCHLIHFQHVRTFIYHTE